MVVEVVESARWGSGRAGGGGGEVRGGPRATRQGGCRCGGSSVSVLDRLVVESQQACGVVQSQAARLVIGSDERLRSWSTRVGRGGVVRGWAWLAVVVGACVVLAGGAVQVEREEGAARRRRVGPNGSIALALLLLAVVVLVPVQPALCSCSESACCASQPPSPPSRPTLDSPRPAPLVRSHLVVVAGLASSSLPALPSLALHPAGPPPRTPKHLPRSP